MPIILFCLAANANGDRDKRTATNRHESLDELTVMNGIEGRSRIITTKIIIVNIEMMLTAKQIH